MHNALYQCTHYIRRTILLMVFLFPTWNISVIMLCVIMLCVIMLRVIMLCVIMQCLILLSTNINNQKYQTAGLHSSTQRKMKTTLVQFEILNLPFNNYRLPQPMSLVLQSSSTFLIYSTYKESNSSYYFHYLFNIHYYHYFYPLIKVIEALKY